LRRLFLIAMSMAAFAASGPADVAARAEKAPVVTCRIVKQADHGAGWKGDRSNTVKRRTGSGATVDLPGPCPCPSRDAAARRRCLRARGILDATQIRRVGGKTYTDDWSTP
jgi:hypothetical protein